MPDGIWRIGDRATFDAFRKTRIRARKGPVWLARVPGDDSDGRIRVAYSVGRKVGPAVHRNKLRRRCRAVMRAAAKSGRLPPGAYLVSTGQGAGQLSFDELRLVLTELVDRVVAGSRSAS